MSRSHLHSVDIRSLWKAMRVTWCVGVAAGLVATAGAAPVFIRGADVSSLPELEQAGAVFREGGAPRDALAILQSHGVNGVRLRLWHSPANGYCDLGHTLVMARRAHALGMSLLLDIHYSDTWADPARQTKPAAWAGLSFDALEASVHDYTLEVVTALVHQGTPPDAVQVGNEITNGMLWPDGHVSGPGDPNWPRLARLLIAGAKGVEEAMGNGRHATLVLHIDRGGDNAASRGYLDAALRNSVPFDEIGLSYYPWWQGGLEALATNVADLAARYGKPVSVVETGYPSTLAWNDSVNNIVGLASQLEPGYPATPAGQSRFLTGVTEAVLRVPHGRGAGVWYWEPVDISAPRLGSVWENVALFDFDGNALPALDRFRVWTVVRLILGAGGPGGRSARERAVAVLREAHGLQGSGIPSVR